MPNLLARRDNSKGGIFFFPSHLKQSVSGKCGMFARFFNKCKFQMSSVGKGRRSLILELRINLIRVVFLEKKKK